MKIINASASASGALAVLLIGTAPGFAIGQTSNAAPATGQLDEIIVTSQRRTELLQDVPLAVSAMTSSDLERAGVRTTNELSQSTPGLLIERSTYNAAPFLRGVGNSSVNPGNDPSVAVYIDGVYQSGPSALVFTFNNIERVEVLKGPQGTLFGRNATGGLVNIITRDPEPGFNGDLTLGYGNFDTQTAKAYVSGGTERIAADLAIVYSDQRDGWGKNLATPAQAGTQLVNGVPVAVPPPKYSDAGFQKEIGVRSKLVFNITDESSLKLSVSYLDSDGDQGVYRRALPGAVLSAGGGAAPYTFNGGFWDESSDVSYEMHNRQSSASVEFTQDFDAITFKSISGYQNTYMTAAVPSDSTPQVSLTNSNKAHLPVETFTQELQLLSSGDRIDWLGGLFYLRSSAAYDPSTVGRGSLEPSFNIFGNQFSTSKAIFGQASADVFEDTRLTLGVRYTKDEFTANQYYLGLRTTTPVISPQFTAGNTTNNVPYQNASSNAVTWRAALDHHFTSDVLGYVSVSRGYKAGGFNIGGMCAIAAGQLGNCQNIAPPVDPETLLDYEIGLKTYLLDRRMRLNIAGFYYKYDDLQVNSVIGLPPVSVLINAASATLYGGEVDLAFAATDNLRLNLGLSAMHSEYDSFNPAVVTVRAPVNNTTNNFFDATGKQLSRAPEFTANLGADYTIGSKMGEFVVGASYYYNNGFFWEPSNRIEQPAYDIVNAFVTFAPTGTDWKFRVWGNNLLNEEHYTFISTSSSGDQGTPAAPRTFGVEANYTF